MTSAHPTALERHCLSGFARCLSSGLIASSLSLLVNNAQWERFDAPYESYPVTLDEAQTIVQKTKWQFGKLPLSDNVLFVPYKDLTGNENFTAVAETLGIKWHGYLPDMHIHERGIFFLRDAIDILIEAGADFPQREKYLAAKAASPSAEEAISTKSR